MMKSVTHPGSDEIHSKIMGQVPKSAFKSPIPIATRKVVRPINRSMPEKSFLKTTGTQKINTGKKVSLGATANPSMNKGVLPPGLAKFMAAKKAGRV